MDDTVIADDIMLVYAPCTEVAVSPELIPAKILACAIYGWEEIKYLCSWFEGYTRHEVWLADYEVKVIGEPMKRPIGFCREATP